MDFSEQSLAEAIVEINRMAEDRGERISIKPTRALFYGSEPERWRSLFLPRLNRRQLFNAKRRSLRRARRGG